MSGPDAGPGRRRTQRPPVPASLTQVIVKPRGSPQTASGSSESHGRLQVFSIVVAILMLVLLLAAGVAMVWAIAGNMKQGIEVRRQLAARLQQLRLGRALTMFGVNAEEYLHTQRIADIEAQMRNCAACDELERCDSSLERGAAEDFDFCPNEQSLRDLAKSGQRVAK